MTEATGWLDRLSRPTERRPAAARWATAIALTIVVAPIAAPVSWIFVVSAFADPQAIAGLFFSFMLGGVPAAIGVAALAGLSVPLARRGRRFRLAPLLGIAAAAGVIAPLPFALALALDDGDLESFLGFAGFLAANGLVAGPLAAWVFQRVLWGRWGHHTA